MFKDKNFFEIIQVGGFTMYVLVFCSILSFAVIIERSIYYFRRSRIPRQVLIDKIRKDYSANHVQNAVNICEHIDTPGAKVALAGLRMHGHEERMIANAMEREVRVEAVKLERFTSILATIGGTGVYVGLFGTVLGIMRAFSDIGKAGSGGMDVITTGIAEALVCTATGLIVAIPAVVSYNYFMRMVDNFVVDMELIASELIDLIFAKKK